MHRRANEDRLFTNANRIFECFERFYLDTFDHIVRNFPKWYDRRSWYSRKGFRTNDWTKDTMTQAENTNKGLENVTKLDD